MLSRREHARARNIIIADTKFEFGIDKAGDLLLIDEVLTPDSSRFWPVASYKPGISPPSFDKQFVRDYLESLHWNKKPPAPHLPPDVLARTSENYREGAQIADGLSVRAATRHAHRCWNVSKTDCSRSRAPWRPPGARCCACCATPPPSRATGWPGDISVRAMSLAYTTLLSLVPLMVFSFSILKGIGARRRSALHPARVLPPLGRRCRSS